VEHAQPVPGHRHQPLHRAQLVHDGLVLAPRAGECEREEADPDGTHDHQARNRPVRNARGGDHVQDQADHRNEIEEPVREHGPDERRPRPVRAALQPQLPRQHRHTRELADPSRQHRVREQAHRERREDELEARMRRRDRLLDHRVPGERAYEDGEQVEPDRNHDPVPLHRVEGVPDGAPIGPAPPDQGNEAGSGDEHDDDPPDRRPQDAQEPPHTSSR
jgi:hypothetical protein